MFLIHCFLTYVPRFWRQGWSTSWKFGRQLNLMQFFTMSSIKTIKQKMINIFLKQSKSPFFFYKKNIWGITNQDCKNVRCFERSSDILIIHMKISISDDFHIKFQHFTVLSHCCLYYEKSDVLMPAADRFKVNEILCMCVKKRDYIRI